MSAATHAKRQYASNHARNGVPVKKRHWPWVVLVVVLLAIAAACTAGYKMYSQAMSAKNHLNTVIEQVKAVKDGDLTETLTKLDPIIETVQSEAAAAKQDLSGAQWDLAEKAPVVGSDITSVRTAVDVLDDFAQTTLPELSSTMQGMMGTSLSDGNGGLNMEPIITAASQMTEANKSIQAQAKTIRELPDAKIGMVQSALASGKEQLDTVADKVDQLTGMLNMLPSFLGSNGARNYVMLAQTNSEIRGAGGLVGSVGSVSADNGKITVGEFHPNVEFAGNVMDQLQKGDSTLYSGLYFGTAIHNVSATPDYPQTARMAAGLWQQQSFGGPSDGVMSLDPVALQAMIGVTGPVTMPDGRVLDGNNTADFLLNGAYIELSVAQQDTYFSAVAAQVVSNLFSDMNTAKMMNLAKVLMDLGSQRHMYFWSFHDEDVETLRSAGVTGELNTDATKPATGFYLNEMSASKIDWYADRSSVVTQTGENTYHVKVTITNTLTAAENAELPEYINAHTPEGAIHDRAIITAPAGGSVSNIVSSDGAKYTAVDTTDRTVYMGNANVPVSSTLTVEWDVTTAAGSEPLKLDQTPSTTTDPKITYQYQQ